jgi:hypothetical protein
MLTTAMTEALRSAPSCTTGGVTAAILHLIHIHEAPSEVGGADVSTISRCCSLAEPLRPPARPGQHGSRWMKVRSPSLPHAEVAEDTAKHIVGRDDPDDPLQRNDGVAQVDRGELRGELGAQRIGERRYLIARAA